MEGEKVKLRALFDFNARVPNELTFKEGQIITLIDKHVSGMWKGELDGQIGLFPYNYVTEIDVSETSVDVYYLFLLNVMKFYYFNLYFYLILGR